MLVKFRFENTDTDKRTCMMTRGVSDISQLTEKAKERIHDCLCEAEHYIIGGPLLADPALLTLDQYLVWLVEGNASKSYKQILSDPNSHVKISVRKY